MSRDFLPTTIPALCEWCENMKLEFPMVASSLGFTGAEITAALSDLSHAIFVCRSAADAGTFASSWVQYRDTLLQGTAGQSVGSLPGTTMPATPSGAQPAAGIIARIRALVKRIKTAPAYTPSIGQSLRILPLAGTPVDLNTVKPDTKATPLPMFKAKLKCTTRGFAAVLTRSRREGEAAWTDLGLSTGGTLTDERPPQEPGKPEVRFYEQIYVRDNAPVGQWSDSVRVTLQP